MKPQKIAQLQAKVMIACGLLLLAQSATVVRADGDALYRELLSPVPAVPDADNAWLAIKKLPPVEIDPKLRGKPFILFPEESSDEKPMGVDQAWLKKQMDANADLLRLGGELLKYSGFQRRLRTYLAADEDSFSGLVPYISRTKMALAENFVRAQDGQLYSSWSNILAEMKFNQLIANAGDVLHSLAANAMLRLGTRHAGWVGQMAPNATTARKFAADLLSFEELREPLTAALKREFQCTEHQAQICRAGGEPLKRMVVEYHFGMRNFKDAATAGPADDPAEDAATEAQWMINPPQSVSDDIEAIKHFDFDALKRKYANELSKPLRVPVTTWVEFRKEFPEYESNEFDLSSLKPTLHKAFQSVLKESSTTVPILYKTLFTSLTQIRLARVALLVKAWQFDHAGVLPETLQELVPDYIPESPIDPFDGKSLRYDKKRKLLWSASKSLADGKHHLEDLVQAIVE